MSTFPPLTPDALTIAVTVYSRRQYVARAIASALNQSMPVRVMVVEDCGPDPELQDYIKAQFGDRIAYYRNPKRRGLFDNWNACLDYCHTPWLSILHDDDYLAPNCLGSIVELARQQPGCALYYGHYKMVDESGNFRPELTVPPVQMPTQRICLKDIYSGTPIAFAGTVFSVEAARAVGGFNPYSQFAGDWQMWSNLISCYGAAATRDHVSCMLSHSGADRGSVVVERAGKIHALNYAQRKRIRTLLKKQGIVTDIDRKAYQARYPISTWLLLNHGATMQPRVLAYNVRLLRLSKSLHWRHAAFKWTAGLLGSRFIRIASQLWSGANRLLRR